MIIDNIFNIEEITINYYTDVNQHFHRLRHRPC